MVTSLLVYDRCINTMCFYLEEDVLGTIIKQGLLTGVIFRFHTQPLIFTCIWSSKCRRRPPLTLLSWMLERTPSTKFHGKLLSKVRLVFVFLPFATVNDKRDFIFSRNFSGFSIIILTIGEIDPPPGKESRCALFWLSLDGFNRKTGCIELYLDPSWRPAILQFLKSKRLQSHPCSHHVHDSGYSWRGWPIIGNYTIH